MKKFAALVLFLLSALVFAACSNDDSTGSEPDGKAAHNAADVTFATGMIPHHEQAVEMADIALATTQNPQITELAQQIKDAQQPEIDTLAEWLKAWGEPMPDASTMGEHSGHGMSGMMSAEDMAMLGKTSGTEFDQMWLQMMIEHHEGAVEMAQTQQADGKYPEAGEMSEQIIASQQEEIDQMKELLSGL